MPSFTNNPTIRRAAGGPHVYEHRCVRCEQWLPLDNEHFYFDRHSRPNPRCKSCYRAWRRESQTLTASGSTEQRGARRFGVEIEFLGSPVDVEREMRARGLVCERQDYNHRTQRCWKIVPDGSVMRGAELVSPILRGDDGFAQLKLACEALRAAGAKVDRTTGLHVHHDVRDFTLDAFKNIAHNWYAAQPQIDCLVARSRRRNTYCEPLSTFDLEQVDSLRRLSRAEVRTYARFGRYRALNFASYPRYGTLEVRQHQGTINYEKIRAWVEFGQAMLKHAKSTRFSDTEYVYTDNRTPTALLAQLELVGGLAPETVEYLARRAAAMAGIPVGAGR